MIPVTIFVDSSFSSDSFFQSSGLKLTIREISSSVSGQQGYSDFAQSDFTSIVSLKWTVISQMLSEGNDIVVFSDIDVVFLERFEGFIRDISQLYALGFQSEARDFFPPTLCTGFMFFTQRAAAEVRELERRSDKGPGGHLDDQVLLNESLRMDIQSYSRVAVLPESHFPNGLMFPLLSGEPHKSAVHRITPFLFHANWVQGVDSKKSMLSAIGQWRVD